MDNGGRDLGDGEPVSIWVAILWYILGGFVFGLIWITGGYRVAKIDKGENDDIRG